MLQATSLRLVIYDPLLLQLLQKRGDIGANLFRIGGAELFLQLRDDLAERALAVAALQHLPARALQFDGAFGEQDHAIRLRPAPAASRRKPRLAGIKRRCHHAFSSFIRNAPGGDQPGCTYAKYRASSWAHRMS